MLFLDIVTICSKILALTLHCEYDTILLPRLRVARDDRRCIFFLCWSIYAFYKRRCRFKEIMSCNPGLDRNRYIRLMILSSMDILGTIPIGTYYLVYNVQQGVRPWVSWADTHSNYSRVVQVPGFIWQSDPSTVQVLEMFRWSLVVCAFLFFAFFGFAREARQNYRHVFTSLAGRFKSSNESSFTSSIPHMRSKGGGVPSSAVTSQDRHSPRISFSSQTSIPSTSITIDLAPDLKVDQYSLSDSAGLSPVDGFKPELHGEIAPGPVVCPAFIPPHQRDNTEHAALPNSSDATDSV
ncbi:pheromone A receptor-domain-containing protein [Russula brevipes]|nr:pheromone A receptor-domain-containing protein [Russula brevipes]